MHSAIRRLQSFVVVVLTTIVLAAPAVAQSGSEIYNFGKVNDGYYRGAQPLDGAGLIDAEIVHRLDHAQRLAVPRARTAAGEARPLRPVGTSMGLDDRLSIITCTPLYRSGIAFPTRDR